MSEIRNRVAESNLITIDMKSFKGSQKRAYLDISPWLFKGMVLKEKLFRNHLESENWKRYQDKFVAIYCSNDVIIPIWAFMLITKNLKPEDKFVSKKQNPPVIEIDFFDEQKNIQNINCFSNEGGEWRNSIMKFDENILKINFREKFTFRRGRVNCSIKDGDLWRWLGIQMSIEVN